MVSGGPRHMGWYRMAVLAVAFVAAVPSSSVAQRADRRAERPQGQGNGTVSYMERTFVFPQEGACVLRYFVDSEAGGDFLRVRVDGTVAFEASGANRAGHASAVVPAGSHEVRVSYEKNGSGTAGRDLAWVDDVRCSGGALSEPFRFEEPLLDAPNGWQAGGAGGGWRVGLHDARRALRRPAAGAFLGYQPGPTRTASERTITWPDTGNPSQRNTVRLVYFVDSEDGHDFLKVFVDNVEKLSVSGREKSATATIDVGAAGAHVVRVEYSKDDSVDEGLDEARVLHLEARVDGAAFEVGGFEGQQVGADPDGWQVASGAAAGWVVASGIEPRSYVTPQTLAAEPVLDGLRDGPYGQGTNVGFLQRGSITSGTAGKARMVLSASTQTLWMLLRAPASTTAAGGEEGEVTLYLDAEHLGTLRGQGCGRPGATPGAEDRRLRVSYEWAGGGGPSVTIAQDIGSCDPMAPWQPAQASEELSAALVVAENTTEDEGFVHFEVSVVLPITGMLEEGVFGLAVETETEPGVVFRLPAFDAHRVLDDDVSSWESVRLGATSELVKQPRHVVIDGAPKPIGTPL
jgi:hypothetical protein